jgi:hypothetical protein
MRIVLIDVFCIILITIGVTMVLRRTNIRGPGMNTIVPGPVDSDPLTYIFRIAGTMLAVFGLALGLSMTIFHFS